MACIQHLTARGSCRVSRVADEYENGWRVCTKTKTARSRRTLYESKNAPPGKPCAPPPPPPFNVKKKSSRLKPHLTEGRPSRDNWATVILNHRTTAAASLFSLRYEGAQSTKVVLDKNGKSKLVRPNTITGTKNLSTASNKFGYGWHIGRKQKEVKAEIESPPRGPNLDPEQVLTTTMLSQARMLSECVADSDKRQFRPRLLQNALALEAG
ncbi:hypothetical protein JOM56_010028 [Amanita muscaria]